MSSNLTPFFCWCVIFFAWRITFYSDLSLSCVCVCAHMLFCSSLVVIILLLYGILYFFLHLLFDECHLFWSLKLPKFSVFPLVFFQVKLPICCLTSSSLNHNELPTESNFLLSNCLCRDETFGRKLIFSLGHLGSLPKTVTTG